MSEVAVGKQRYDFLDVAKAVGIYLVILGHMVIFNWKEFRFIFAFHMPLFFVVAGFIWGGRREMPKWHDYIVRQIKHYLIPLLAVFVLSILQCIILPLGEHDLKHLLSSDTLKDLYEGQYRFSFFGASWFLWCMFWSQLMYYGIQVLKRKCKLYIYILIWILFVLLAVYAPDIFSFIPKYRRLPLKIDSAFMATVFMGVGHLLNRFYYKCKLDQKAMVRYIVASIMLVLGIPIVYFVSCKGNTYVNLCDVVYARPERYLIGSVFGSFMVIGASILLEKIRILQYIGQNTLVIFLCHSVFINLAVSLTNRILHLNLVPQYMNFDLVCIVLSIMVLTPSTAVAALFGFGKKIIRKAGSQNRK